MNSTIASKVGRKMIKVKLKQYLKEHNIPLQYVSDTTGIRYATLYSIYDMNIEKLNLNYLDAIMDALNISDVSLMLEKVDDDI